MTTQSIESRDRAMDPRSTAANDPFDVPLAGFAIAASTLDLLLARGALRLIGNFAHRSFALGLEMTSRFVRNTAAVAVLLGLLVVIQRAMRSPAVDFGLSRRVLLGTLAGILLPVIGIALALPDAHTTVILLLVGIASAYLMAFVFALSAFDRDASITQRVACAFVLFFAAASLGSYVVEMWARLPGIEVEHVPTRTFRNLVELAYFALPVSLGIAVIAERRVRLPVGHLAIALGAALVTFLGITFVEHALPEDFDLLLYGALRLEALDGASDYAYASLLGLSVAGVALALLDPSRRRLGVGAALVLLAGAGAGSPFALAHVVLGAGALGVVLRPGEARDQTFSAGSSQSVSYTPGS